MIIRTSIAERGSANIALPRQLSKREQRRLENTKYPKGKIAEAPIEDTESIENIVPVRVEETQEKEPAVPEETIVEPGTAIIRSKALEELEKNKVEKPKKKYKIISIG